MAWLDGRRAGARLRGVLTLRRRARRQIKDGNEPSRRLFERLGFRLLKHVAVFSEAHWVLDGGAELDHARRAELDEVSVV